MKKTIYKGKTSLEIIKPKESSELVSEQTGQASYLMQEIRHKEGL